MIDARDVFRVFPTAQGGVAALRGLTLAVPPGEICVVLGPSGSGKTTLMRVLAGLERPSAGSVRVAGEDLRSLSDGRLARFRATRLGYADQHYWLALAAELTAIELVGLPLGLAGVGRVERRRRALELLERVGLADRAGARPKELSGGEQQRIALAAALVAGPAVLVADEPTGELDAAAADAVFDLLAELVREHAVTAIVVSHDPASTRIADRVVHIRDGRVSEEGDAGAETAVVGAGGWLRVPEDVLRAAGIGDRAEVVGRDGAIELRALAGPQETSAAAARRLPGRPGVVVEVRGLVRSYGAEVALDGLSARFEPGRLTVVTGPSGSGKSTLLALVAGLDVPDSGDIVLGDVAMTGLDREGCALVRRELLAYVGQAPALSGFLTARESVELALGLRGEQDRGGVSAVEVLTRVGLEAEVAREVDQLSAGQRERVALARALASRPRVLLVDEPTSRLDLVTTAEIGRLLAALAHEEGTTVVCATHDAVLVDHADAELRLGSVPVRSG